MGTCERMLLRSISEGDSRSWKKVQADLSRLDYSENQASKARDKLSELDYIHRGKGGAGGVISITADGKEAVAEDLKTSGGTILKEKDLYDPMAEIDETGNATGGLAECVEAFPEGDPEVRWIDTHGQSGANTGMWSRPDRTRVSRRLLANINHTIIIIESFEIKEKIDIRGVYEAKHQGRTADRAWVVMNNPMNDDVSTVLQTCIDEGVGLITCTDPHEADSYAVHVRPEHNVPMPHLLESYVEKHLLLKASNHSEGLKDVLIAWLRDKKFV